MMPDRVTRGHILCVHYAWTHKSQYHTFTSFVPCLRCRIIFFNQPKALLVHWGWISSLLSALVEWCLKTNEISVFITTLPWTLKVRWRSCTWSGGGWGGGGGEVSRGLLFCTLIQLMSMMVGNLTFSSVHFLMTQYFCKGVVGDSDPKRNN